MTKAELVADVAAATGDEASEIETIVDATIVAITASLGTGEKVSLGPLGTFATRTESAHEGYNIGTGETEEMPARVRVLFHPSPTLRDAVIGLTGE